MDKINTRLLKYIITIADEKSISSASRKLYVSQPSLSKTPIELEKEIGVTLFDRSSLPLQLTYAGELFVDSARRILQIERSLDACLGELASGLMGELKIGISLFRNSVILPKVMPVYYEKYSDVEIELFESTNQHLVDLMNNGTLDIAFITNTTPISGVECVELCEDRMLLAVCKKHAICSDYVVGDDYPSVDINLLKDDPFTVLKPGTMSYQVSQNLFQSVGFKPKNMILTSSIEFATRMAASGATASLVLESVRQLFSQDQQPNFFQVKGFDGRIKLYLCHQKSNLPKYILDFVSICRSQIGGTGAFI